MSREDLREDWLEDKSRWTTFTNRFFVLCAEEGSQGDQVSNLSYFTDETCRNQRGCLSITSSVVAAFQTTKVPWREFAEEDLKYESPVFLTLSCEDWLVVLCPETDEDSVTWRSAFDMTVHKARAQENLRNKETLGKVSASLK